MFMNCIECPLKDCRQKGRLLYIKDKFGRSSDDIVNEKNFMDAVIVSQKQFFGENCSIRVPCYPGEGCRVPRLGCRGLVMSWTGGQPNPSIMSPNINQGHDNYL